MFIKNIYKEVISIKDMKKLSAFLLSAFILGTQSSFAFAKEITPIEIVNKVLEMKQQSFTGTKLQKVVRQNLKLEANANVEYVNSENFNITLKQPSGISGIKFATNSGKSAIYFPYEKLSFTDAVSTSGEMITDTVLGKITTDADLLQKNYNVTMKNDDEIATNPTYVIDIQPKRQVDSHWGTPGRTYWVSKNNFQILREDRYWAPNIEPFFSSQFTDYKALSFSTSPNVRLKLPYDVKKVELGEKNEKSETYLQSFKSADEAEKKSKEKIYLPNYLPEGFKLKELQLLNFYDTKIIVQKYTDGLNSMFVTYRTKPNFFLTLVAGAFSLNLIHKMSDLSYHAPYNYMSKETKENLIISFGDLYPDDLQKVCSSLSLK